MVFLFDKIVSGTGIPLILLFVISLLTLFRHNIKSFFIFSSILFFAVFWRAFFVMESSRYCASFILISFFAFLFASRYWVGIPEKRGINILLCACLLTIIIFINAIKLNSPFANVYLFDVKDKLNSVLSDENNSRVFIEGKDFNRLRFHEEFLDRRLFELEWRTTPEEVKRLLSEYSLCGAPLYFFFSDKTSSSGYNQLVFSSEKSSFRKIQEFHTNKNGRNRFSIYSYQVPPLILYKNSNKELAQPTNLILNGDIEIIQDNATTQKQFMKWISAGIDYYAKDSLFLPKNQMLVPFSVIPPPNCYPKVYADSDNVINGKYSLNIAFPTASKNIVLFMNKFTSQPGELSFLVKNLGKESRFSLARWDYSNGRGVTAPGSTRHFFLDDQEIHQIKFTVGEDEYLGIDRKSIFYVYGNGVNFLIDDISFTPFQSTKSTL